MGQVGYPAQKAAGVSQSRSCACQVHENSMHTILRLMGNDKVEVLRATEARQMDHRYVKKDHTWRAIERGSRLEWA